MTWKPHFSNYHQKKSLVLQFILSEFFRISEVIYTMSDLLHSERQQIFKLAEQLESIFKELAGPFHDFRRLFAWNFEEGKVSKLKHFCELLLHEKIAPDPLFYDLHMQVEQLHQHTIMTLDALHKYLNQETKELPLFIEPLKKTLNFVLQTSLVIEKIVQKEGRDENIILFLLENAQLVKNIFGPHYFNTLFQKLFPDANHPISQYMITQYTKRGFPHFIPRIQQMLMEACI